MGGGGSLEPEMWSEAQGAEQSFDAARDYDSARAWAHYVVEGSEFLPPDQLRTLISSTGEAYAAVIAAGGSEADAHRISLEVTDLPHEPRQVGNHALKALELLHEQSRQEAANG